MLLFVICSFSINNSFNHFVKFENIMNNKESTKSAFLSDSIFTFMSDGSIEINGQMDCVSKIFTCPDNILQGKTNQEELKNLNMTDISNDTLGCIYKKMLQKDGTIKSESFINPLINLTYWKYYKYGKLYSCGFTSREQGVGRWKCQSQTGNLDSIIDYDKDKIVTYCKFFEIAKAFGMVGKSSRMPERQKLFQIADSLGLTVILSGIIYYNLRAGWMNYDFYPVKEEEIDERFQSEIFYSNSRNNKEWTVIKKFKIQTQVLQFCLSLDLGKMTIRQYEYPIQHISTGINQLPER